MAVDSLRNKLYRLTRQARKGKKNPKENTMAYDRRNYTDDAQTPDFLARVRRHAAAHVRNGSLTADWINPHMAALGLDPISRTNDYKFKATATATGTVHIEATNRAEAATKAAEYLAAGRFRSGWRNEQVTVDPASIELLDGPEDTDTIEKAEAPTTIEDAKARVRTIILDSVTTGGACLGGARDEWRSLGLGDFPETTRYEVEIPVTGVAKMRFDTFSEDDAKKAATKALTRQRGEDPYLTLGNAQFDADAVTITVR